MAMSKMSNNGASSGESYEHADGPSEASSQERPPTAFLKWRAGCFAKYKLGGCADPSCNRAHDLNPGEICCFLSWLEQTHHVIFQDSSSETRGPMAHRGSDSSSETQGAQFHTDPGDRCTSERLEYEDLQRSLRERFRGMSDAMLLTQLPPTKSGKLSSMGSVLHVTGKCRPCRNMFALHGCPDGLRCLYCHQEHSALSQLVESHLSCVDEHDNQEENGDARRSSKFRPSKAKRDHYKEMIKELEADIHKDPFGWRLENVAIPPAVANKPTVKKKLLMRLAMLADAARSSQMQCSTQPASEAETVVSGNDNPKMKDRSRQLISL